MTDKFNRARESVRSFMRTSNPKDEFFVVGFNDRPELLEDFTSSIDDIDARLALVNPVSVPLYSTRSTTVSIR